MNTALARGGATLIGLIGIFTIPFGVGVPLIIVAVCIHLALKS